MSTGTFLKAIYISKGGKITDQSQGTVEKDLERILDDCESFAALTYFPYSRHWG